MGEERRVTLLETDSISSSDEEDEPILLKPGAPDDKTKAVFIKNIPWGMTEAHLVSAYATHGIIIRADMKERGRGHNKFAFIHYHSKLAAKAALEQKWLPVEYNGRKAILLALPLRARKRSCGCIHRFAVSVPLV